MTKSSTLDPILSPREMAADAGVSLSTWERNYRRRIEILRISPRRIGAKRSVWRKALEAAVERRPRGTGSDQ